MANVLHKFVSNTKISPSQVNENFEFLKEDITTVSESINPKVTSIKETILSDVQTVKESLEESIQGLDELPHIIKVSDKSILPNFYIIYSNGLCYQGGIGSNSKVTVSLLIPYKDTNYTILASPRNGTLNNGSGSYNVYMTINDITENGFYYSFTGGNLKNVSWETKGYINLDEVLDEL